MSTSSSGTLVSRGSFGKTRIAAFYELVQTWKTSGFDGDYVEKARGQKSRTRGKVKGGLSMPLCYNYAPRH